MSTIAARYAELTRKSASAQLNEVLNAIIAGQVRTADERETLVKLILEDLQNKDTGRLGAKDQPKAVLALKTLGREPDAARVLGTKPSLAFLLTITSISQEVTRIIANTLLLYAPGRRNFIDVNGADYAFTTLSSTTDTTTLFIACRLLFLITHDSTSIDCITALLEKTNILEVTMNKMEFLTKKLADANDKAMAVMGLTDMLKYIYNMILHYSRAGMEGSPAMGEAWSDKFTPWVAPLLRLFGTIPFTMTPPTPLSTPITHVIHCLLNVPIEPYESTWFPAGRRSRSNSPPQSLTSRARSLFTSNNSSPRQGSPSSDRSEPKSPKPKADDQDYTLRAYELVNKCLEHYFPGACDVDGEDVRARQTAEDVKLNELLPPCFLLLRKIADENEAARRRIRNWLLPEDLDRKNPLQERPDFLGRLIRLLSSVHFNSLQKCSGELLFAICDSDAATLSAQVGYGNVAGYLFNKQIMFSPPTNATASSSSSSTNGANGKRINPITGTEYQEIDTSGLEEMTEEEKEREAEKLFVLFDRLEKSGMGTNPIRQAQQEGKLEKYRQDSKDDSD